MGADRELGGRDSRNGLHLSKAAEKAAGRSNNNGCCLRRAERVCLEIVGILIPFESSGGALFLMGFVRFRSPIRYNQEGLGAKRPPGVNCASRGRGDQNISSERRLERRILEL